MENKSFKPTKRDIAVVAIATAFVGAISWIPVSTLSTNSIWRTKAASIAKGTQYYEEGGLIYNTRCTWNVINKPGDVDGKPEMFQMMANGHCDNRSDSNTYEMLFPNGDIYICSADSVAFSPWEVMDFKIVNCPAKPGVVIPPIEISRDTDLKPGTRLAHISWNCNYFKDSQCTPVPMIDISTECKVIKENEINAGGLLNSVSQGCDSQGGSSGSALYSFLDENGNEGGHVVALHNSEVRGPNHHIDGSGPENRSIHIKFVVDEAHRQDPSIKFYFAGQTNDEEIIIEDPFVDTEAKQCKSLGQQLLELFKSIFA